MTEIALRALLGAVPVLAFLLVLHYLDSFKLVRMRAIAEAILVGAGIAVFCYFFNGIPFDADDWAWSRFGAPIFEEWMKAGYVYILIRRGRIGFMVDAAMHGFAVGAGFALVENLVYLESLAGSGVFVWVLRGFGTAIMHSGTTAIVGALAAGIIDQKRRRDWTVFVPGLLIGFAIHIAFNSGIARPAETAALTLAVVPSILGFIFLRNEKRLESWLTQEMDQELDTILMIESGEFSNTSAGSFLRQMRETFPAAVVGDMFCYISMTLELTLQAKGNLLRKSAGLEVEEDPEVPAKLQELAFLEKSIGRAGMRALAPMLGSSAATLSQLRAAVPKN